jgi:hypothetical protein
LTVGTCEMRLEVIELFEKIFFCEVAVLLRPDVTVVGQHAHDLHVLDLTRELLDFFLKVYIE